MNKIGEAYIFMCDAHEGQKRLYNGLPYDTHPREVGRILESVTNDEDIICAGYLHDVIEDTKITYDKIRNNFGIRVANIVQEVTKDDKGKFHIHSREALMVKLADMLHNVSDSPDNNYIKSKIKFVKDLEKENE